MHSLKLNFQEGDLPSLHPHDLMIYLRGISLSKMLYECLTRIDSEGKPQLAAAESVDISPDRLNYTFKLRNNKWSDGSPVTAYQYEAGWKEALSPSSSCSRADLLYAIKNGEKAKRGEVPLSAIGVKAIDEKTLSVDLEGPCPYLLVLTAQPICAPLVDISKKEPATFNGPFQIASWKHNDYIRLKKNPFYWDQKEIDLEQIDIYMVQDATTAFTMYEKGKIDWVGVPFVPLSNEIINHLEQDHQLKSHPIDRAYWVFLNTEHPSLKSPSIRQALSMAVDRSAIAKHILIGTRPLKKPLPDEVLPTTDPAMIEENLTKAKIKFEKGLEELNMTKENFPPLVITYSQQAGRKQIAEYLQQVWSQAFGVKVLAEPQEWNILRTNLEKGHYQVSGCFEAAFNHDPMEIMDKMTTINPNNFSKWINPEFISIVSQAKKESNFDQRVKLLANAEQIMAEQMPLIPICSDKFMFAHHPELKGYVFDYVGACDFSRATIDN